MNTFKKALESRGITVMEASKQGLPYSTVRKHWLGERELGLKSVIRYEQILGIHQLSPAFPPNPKRPAMLTNLLIAIGVVVVVAFIFSPAG